MPVTPTRNRVNPEKIDTTPMRRPRLDPGAGAFG